MTGFCALHAQKQNVAFGLPGSDEWATDAWDRGCLGLDGSSTTGDHREVVSRRL